MDKKYKVGMYGGKFMPFHKGHMYCVEQAAKMCEKLYLLLFFGSDQEIKILKQQPNEKWLLPESRLAHMIKACKKIDNVIVKAIDVTNCKKEDGTEDWEAETPLVLSACGEIDAVFGSESSYSDYFSKAYPNADYIIIDENRDTFPISGTMIRAMNEEERKKWII